MKERDVRTLCYRCASEMKKMWVLNYIEPVALDLSVISVIGLEVTMK